MKKITIKKIRISLAVALILCVAASLTHFESACRDLRDNVLRLHILANSDSDADQALKLKVRDAVIECGAAKLDNCDNLDEALIVAAENKEKILETARNVIKQNGYDYSVSLEIGKEYFSTRVYDEFTLPAGNYDSVIIKIGNAEGKNWWCIMYPSFCVRAASNCDLEKAAGKDGAEIALKPQKYQIRFKIVEYYESLKKIITKK
ncbi:MAG: stage II sporulation protein R [Clostridiales bacterium]|nr:stage II sporulation protein R [Candidatus Equinaster intestinalis]